MRLPAVSLFRAELVVLRGRSARNDYWETMEKNMSDEFIVIRMYNLVVQLIRS